MPWAEILFRILRRNNTKNINVISPTGDCKQLVFCHLFFSEEVTGLCISTVVNVMRKRPEEVHIATILFFSIELIWELLFLLMKAGNIRDYFACLATPVVFSTCPFLISWNTSPWMCTNFDMNIWLLSCYTKKFMWSWKPSQKASRKLSTINKTEDFSVRADQKRHQKFTVDCIDLTPLKRNEQTWYWHLKVCWVTILTHCIHCHF